MMKSLRQLAEVVDRADMGGWAMLLSGFALIALTVLMPNCLDLQALRVQHAGRQATFAQHDQQRRNYQQFIAAVRTGDPLLLQRLAWHELHLKPEGVRTVADVSPAEPGQTMHFEQWLRCEAPPAAEAPIPEPPDCRLVRLTTGPPRMGMLVLGGLLVASGLLTSMRPTNTDG